MERAREVSKRSETGRRIAHRMIDPDFRATLTRRDTGEHSYVVGDWADSLGDIYGGMDKFGYPTTLLMPSGDGFLRFTITADDESSAPTAEESWIYDPEEPLALFLLEVMKVGRLHLDMESSVHKLRPLRRAHARHQLIFDFQSEAA